MGNPSSASHVMDCGSVAVIRWGRSSAHADSWPDWMEFSTQTRAISHVAADVPLGHAAERHLAHRNFCLHQIARSWRGDRRSYNSPLLLPHPAQTFSSAGCRITLRLWNLSQGNRIGFDQILKVGSMRSSIRPVLWRCYAPGHHGIRQRALAFQRGQTRCLRMIRKAHRAYRSSIRGAPAPSAFQYCGRAAFMRLMFDRSVGLAAAGFSPHQKQRNQRAAQLPTLSSSSASRTDCAGANSARRRSR
jgi:hypothetical protein